MSADRNVALLLGASPADRDALLLSAEFDTINAAVRQGTFRDDLRVERSQNTLASELVPDLLHHDPALVHFSGHGRESGELIFENPDGSSNPLQPELLATIFQRFSDSLQCVVLNACWSDTQASIITDHIPAVVGMSSTVTDFGSLNFSNTFYLGIAEGKSVSEAYSLAVLQLRVASPEDAGAPILRVQQGAGEVVLAGPGQRSTAAATTDPGSTERQDLITALFTVHYGPLVRIASTLLDDIPGAEEIVRAAFVDLLYAVDLPNVGEEPAFLRSHVMGAAKSLLNQRRVVDESTGVSAAAKRARVLDALRGLPHPQSEVLLLKHLGALNHEQIGTVLDMSPASVAENAAGGLDALSALLDEAAA